MLDRLPNEIVLKTLKKTQLGTRRNCRLLNERTNNLILKFGLNREDKKRLELCGYENSGYYNVITGGGLTWKITYDDTTTKLSQLTNNTRKVDNIFLRHIELNKQVLDDLLNIRKILTLKVINCKVTDQDQWINFLNEIKIEELHVRYKDIPLPLMILRGVTTTFAQRSMSGSHPDVSWLNDEVLLQWIEPHKKIDAWNCHTGLTLGGIANCLKKIENCSNHEKYTTCEFGILDNMTSKTMEDAIEAVKEAFTVRRGTFPFGVQPYIITSKTDATIKAVFQCTV